MECDAGVKIIRRENYKGCVDSLMLSNDDFATGRKQPNMTELIASIAGPYLFVTGLGFLISRDFYRRMIAAQQKADPILINLSGATHFVVGAILLANHFRWSSIAESVVSLVGLAAVLKGVTLIVVPERTQSSPQMGNTGFLATSAGFLAVGTYLLIVALS